jgi:hypothetical protein
MEVTVGAASIVAIVVDAPLRPATFASFRGLKLPSDGSSVRIEDM